MRKSVSMEQEHIKGAKTTDEVYEGKYECKRAG
jgi:hypothetical protein